MTAYWIKNLKTGGRCLISNPDVVEHYRREDPKLWAVSPYIEDEDPAPVASAASEQKKEAPKKAPKVDLESLTVNQLRSRAADAGIKGGARMSKSALLELLAKEGE